MRYLTEAFNFNDILNNSKGSNTTQNKTGANAIINKILSRSLLNQSMGALAAELVKKAYCQNTPIKDVIEHSYNVILRSYESEDFKMGNNIFKAATRKTKYPDSKLLQALTTIGWKIIINDHFAITKMALGLSDPTIDAMSYKLRCAYLQQNYPNLNENNINRLAQHGSDDIHDKDIIDIYTLLVSPYDTANTRHQASWLHYCAINTFGVSPDGGMIVIIFEDYSDLAPMDNYYRKTVFLYTGRVIYEKSDIANTQKNKEELKKFYKLLTHIFDSYTKASRRLTLPSNYAYLFTNNIPTICYAWESKIGSVPKYIQDLRSKVIDYNKWIPIDILQDPNKKEQLLYYFLYKDYVIVCELTEEPQVKNTRKGKLNFLLCDLLLFNKKYKSMITYSKDSANSLLSLLNDIINDMKISINDLEDIDINSLNTDDIINAFKNKWLK